MLTKKLSYGDPMDINNKLGTLIDENAAINVERRVNDAIDCGAELIFGNIRERCNFLTNNFGSC